MKVTLPHEINRKLLIVGSGFIATELAKMASGHWGWSVEVLFRNYKNPSLKYLPHRPLPSNVLDLVALLDEACPTDVVIATGSSFVPEINSNITNALDQHLSGNLMVLDALARAKHGLAGRVLMIGSASEYGEFSLDPVTEEHPALPRDQYGIIKLSLRQLGQYFFREYGLPVVHLRQFNVTGPNQDERFVVPSICRQIANGTLDSKGEKPVRVIAGNTSVKRDFLAISDVCEAYRTLMLQGRPGEVYNVCSGNACSIDHLISIAAEVAGVRIIVETSQKLLRESDKVQGMICGDPTKLRLLGWKPKVPVRELLATMLDKYMSIKSNEPHLNDKRN